MSTPKSGRSSSESERYQASVRTRRPYVIQDLGILADFLISEWVAEYWAERVRA